MSSKYRSLVGRRGKKRALIAVGHKILIASYYILKNKMEYKELGQEYLDNFRKDKLLAYYIKQIQKLDPDYSLEHKTKTV